MGFLDRLLGRTPTEQQHQQGATWDSGRNPRSAATPPRPQVSDEERAVARYRYLLRTAPPEQLEALHAEAFAKLTPDQRQQLLRELATASPGGGGHLERARRPGAGRHPRRDAPAGHPAEHLLARLRSGAAWGWAGCSPAR